MVWDDIINLSRETLLLLGVENTQVHSVSLERILFLPIKITVDLWGESEKGNSAYIQKFFFFEKNKGDGWEFTNIKRVLRILVLKKHLGGHLKVAYLKSPLPTTKKFPGVNISYLSGSSLIFSDCKGEIKSSRV